MTKPILSICIATYNRAEYISVTLDSIVPQLTDQVEIVVVDGASTDATSEVVSRYCRNFNNIKYTKLSEKGGVDRDYCKAVALAAGDYCWLFPDDDLLNPGAIEAVLHAIAKGFCLIIINASVLDKSLKRRLQDRRLPNTRDEIYAEAELPQLFQRAIPYISFIGCVVINRDLWMQREKEKYYNSEFIHVGVIFQAPLNAPVLVMAEPYISIRLGNAQWSRRSYEIWMVKWPNLLLSFDQIPISLRTRFATPPALSRLEHLVTLRATGAFSFNIFKDWFNSRRFTISWRMFAFVILLIPASFTNFLLLTLLKLRRQSSPIAIYNLEENPCNILMRKRRETKQRSSSKEPLCI